MCVVDHMYNNRPGYLGLKKRQRTLINWFEKYIERMPIQKLVLPLSLTAQGAL
jgi:hypothetical protein